MATKQASKAGGSQVIKSDSLLDDIVAQTRISKEDDGYDTAKKGVVEFLKVMLKDTTAQRVEKKRVDVMLDELDERLSRQMDEILHNPEFQKMESAWRSLKTLVDRTNFRENIIMQIIDVSKDELLEDFEDAGDETKSGLYQHIYTNEYGQFGGEPVGVVIGNYTFKPSVQAALTHKIF